MNKQENNKEEKTKPELYTLLGEVAVMKINELIGNGWEFTLHYGDHMTYCEIEEPSWEADFTKKKVNGKWDNHKCGYGTLPDDAVNKAYDNIKNGLRLSKGI